MRGASSNPVQPYRGVVKATAGSCFVNAGIFVVVLRASFPYLTAPLRSERVICSGETLFFAHLCR